MNESPAMSAGPNTPRATSRFFTIERCRIAGFKSIREAEIELGALNVVIGANGAGKSNLVSFFGYLRDALGGRLAQHVGRAGGPNAILYLGTKVTDRMECEITIRSLIGRAKLYQAVQFQAPDALMFTAPQHYAPEPEGWSQAYSFLPSSWISLEQSPSSQLSNLSQVHRYLEEGTAVYHFHDTTLTSGIRTAGYIEDNRRLLGDGGNLAAFLYRIRETQRDVYDRIVATVRLVAPFFDDFRLAPQMLDPRRILLNWRQKGSETEFGPHQLSDGTIRAMALIALLLQPEAELPELIVIDEPEIGLHPYAIEVVAALLEKASFHTQVIVATQSPQLLDACDPKDVICVDRQGAESIFTRPEPEKLEEWLEDYSLGDVWRKNLIGGGPH